MNDWKIKELQARDAILKEYADYMAKNSKPLSIKPKSDVQAPSTKAVLERDPKLDGLRKIELTDLGYWGYLKAKAEIPRDKWIEREISPEEYHLFETARRRPKNSLGQSEKEGSSSDRKEMARQAFMCTPPAPLDDLKLKEITRATEIQKLKTWKEEWRTLTTWQAFWHWIKGGKVKRVKDEK